MKSIVFLKTATKVSASISSRVDRKNSRLHRPEARSLESLLKSSFVEEKADELEPALEQFRLIAKDLGSDTSEKVI